IQYAILVSDQPAPFGGCFHHLLPGMVVLMTLRRLASGLIAALAMIGLAACTGDAKDTSDAPVIVPGGPGEPAKTLPPGQRPSVASAAPNEADVTFVSHMVVHHQQALDMAALVPDRAANASVK